MTTNNNLGKSNGVPQKEADSKQERLLLGFLGEEAANIQFGEIHVVFTVRAGRIDRVKSEKVSRTFNVGQRDG